MYDSYQYANNQRSVAYEYLGPTSHLENRRSYLLDCSVQIADGRLVIRWRYSKNLHQQATIKRLAQDYIQKLQTLVAGQTVL